MFVFFDSFILLCDLDNDNYIVIEQMTYEDFCATVSNWGSTTSKDNLYEYVQKNQLIDAAHQAIENPVHCNMRHRPIDTFDLPKDIVDSSHMSVLGYLKLSIDVIIIYTIRSYIAIMLQMFGLRSILKLRPAETVKTGNCDDCSNILKFVRRFRRAQGFNVFNKSCLYDGLSLMYFLRLFGLNTYLIFGFDVFRCEFHCWLQFERYAITGTSHLIKRFTVFAVSA